MCWAICILSNLFDKISIILRGFAGVGLWFWLKACDGWCYHFACQFSVLTEKNNRICFWQLVNIGHILLLNEQTARSANVHNDQKRVKEIEWKKSTDRYKTCGVTNKRKTLIKNDHIPRAIPFYLHSIHKFCCWFFFFISVREYVWMLMLLFEFMMHSMPRSHTCTLHTQSTFTSTKLLIKNLK